MKALLCALLLATMTACCPYCPPVDGYIPGGPNIPELEYVVVTYGDELLREKRLYLRCAHAHYDTDSIEKVEMYFRTQAIMDVDEGRDLMVYLVEGFLARVNEDESLNGDLSSYPFDPTNLKVEIEFESYYVKYIDEDYLARITMDKGMVSYYSHTAINPDYANFRQRTEPYVKTLHFSKYKTYRPWLNATWHDPKKNVNPETEDSAAYLMID